MNFNEILATFYKSPVLTYFVIIWILFWKGMALWKASQKRQLVWFLILMVLNTMGLLEIVYFYYLNKYDLDKGKLLNFLEKRFKKK